MYQNCSILFKFTYKIQLKVQTMENFFLFLYGNGDYPTKNCGRFIPQVLFRIPKLFKA